MKKAIVVLLVAVLLVASFVACGGGSSSTILGSWVRPEHADDEFATFTFFENGVIEGGRSFGSGREYHTFDLLSDGTVMLSSGYINVHTNIYTRADTPDDLGSREYYVSRDGNTLLVYGDEFIRFGN